MTTNAVTNAIRIDGQNLAGNIATLAFDIDVIGTPVNSDNEKAPKFRLLSSSPRGRRVEVGGVWENQNADGNPAVIHATASQRGGEAETRGGLYSEGQTALLDVGAGLWGSDPAVTVTTILGGELRVGRWARLHLYVGLFRRVLLTRV